MIRDTARKALILGMMLMAAWTVWGVCARAQNVDEQSMKGLEWRQIGPFRGGRVIAVTGVVGEPSTYYFGAVAGGVWKTTNGGWTWTPLTDKTSIMSVGAIAVAPSDPNVVYVGTGESCLRGNISFGDGMYRSVDAGKTWTHIGLEDSRHIAKILVSPHDPNLVYVAAFGHAYGSNEMRGVYRSADGGKTWQRILFKDEKTGAIDLDFDPHNSHILFAAMWEANRTPWGMTSGGPGSGLYRSADGGDTWKHLEGNGLPSGVLGRIGVSVSGADSNRVYAIIEAEKGGIYRSDDSGEHWHLVNGDHRYTQRAWYFHHIFADPANADTLYVLNTAIYKSVDGGKSFNFVRAPHGDNHGLWIDPTNPARMINGNDGGATISSDGGKSWSTQLNQPTAQFYHVAVDTDVPYHIYGAQQDNSTIAIASRTDRGLIDRPDWHAVGGGESGYVVPDPQDPNIVYAGSYDGLITRYNQKNSQEQDISPWPLNPMGSGAAELLHRFQWTAPIMMSANDPGALYFGGEGVFKSTNGGMSWTEISPDLTRNDKSKQQSSGGPITQDNTSVEYYDTVFTIAESPVEKGVIWAGSDDGLIHLTRDGGQHWTDVTSKQFGDWSMISLIDPSPHSAGTAYAAVDRHRLDDYRPYIFKTSDFGKTWTRLTNGLPENASVHAVREDPKKPGLLFAGTEIGIYVSFDDGGHWQSLRLNLPETPIHDLAIKDDALIVATHGRSFWSLDDISPLRQMTKATEEEEVHLFHPATAYRFQGPGFFIVTGIPAGHNPPTGVVLFYSLKEKPKDALTLEILDAKGKLVRKYSSKKEHAAEEEQEFPQLGGAGDLLPAEKGVNRFVWNMRAERPARVPGLSEWGGQGEGPEVPPGTYQLKLTVGGKTYSAQAELRKDPRVSTSQADFDKQFELASRISASVNEGHQAVNQIRSVRAQMEALKKRLGDGEKVKPIVEAINALNKKLDATEGKLVDPKAKSNEDSLNYPIQVCAKLTILGFTVESADTAPTEQSEVVYKDLEGRLNTQLAAWRDIKEKDLAALNAEIEKAHIPPIAPAAEEKK